ncbi:MAG: outer membrane protein assembly factor BamC [Candidatus Thioglobus sp.]|nr:outer membrane protein assembly factor BamC [Candidatus Thioglobus sp.]
MLKKLLITFLALALGGCFSFADKKKSQTTSGLGERDIKYYANKTVSSLEVPPDLTKPSSENAFRLSEYVSGLQEQTVTFSDKDKSKKSEILQSSTNIQVKKSGNRRWLLVDKKPDEVWNLTRSFLKSNGFAIKKANKKTGLIETDFLENRPDIPDQSLGFIRAALKDLINARYALPVIDKYRARIEPTENPNQSEVFLSLTSVEEVATSNQSTQSENTTWQARSKDEALETEMLYRLMVFLGSDQLAAKEKITNARQAKRIKVKLSTDINGYGKLIIPLNQYEAWRNVGWAFDQLEIDIEDKDVKEGSFYINIARAKDRGILSRLFGESAIRKSFQILVKQISEGVTEVYFNDLSEKNEQATIDFSHQFLGKLVKQF